MGNSARSILAESLVNHWGRAKFRGFSAGSFPKGRVHPMAPTENLRSKSWEEFAAPGAPPLDLIFTVCDNAAGEVCPVWPGKPLTAHWAFGKALKEMETRIKLFTELPIASLDRMKLQETLRAIGKQTAAADI